jgi:hypothetical protein
LHCNHRPARAFLLSAALLDAGRRRLVRAMTCATSQVLSSRAGCPTSSGVSSSQSKSPGPSGGGQLLLLLLVPRSGAAERHGAGRPTWRPNFCCAGRGRRPAVAELPQTVRARLLLVQLTPRCRQVECCPPVAGTRSLRHAGWLVCGFKRLQCIERRRGLRRPYGDIAAVASGTKHSLVQGRMGTDGCAQRRPRCSVSAMRTAEGERRQRLAQRLGRLQAAGLVKGRVCRSGGHRRACSCTSASGSRCSTLNMLTSQLCHAFPESGRRGAAHVAP